MYSCKPLPASLPRHQRQCQLSFIRIYMPLVRIYYTRNQAKAHRSNNGLFNSLPSVTLHQQQVMITPWVMCAG
jgi:deoxycytidine triphosphate deaminase